MTRDEVAVAADMGGAEGALLDREHAVIKICCVCITLWPAKS